MNLDSLRNRPRLLMEAKLRPVQGERFQPTGFPDLGAATYATPDGTQMLLVESAQSMANHLEAVCWDKAADDLIAPCKGLPYVRSKVSDGQLTTSILEAHRLNSPYIMSTKEDFAEKLRKEAKIPGKKEKQKAEDEDAEGGEGAVNIRNLARACFKYDPNSVLHGVFLEKLDGRARLPRLLSAYIEARGASPVESGGVKVDRISPSGDTALGYGNVPFHRREFVAAEMMAYFNLDLAQMRGYGLGKEAEDLLVLLALYKVRRFLEAGLRLRTACDLSSDGLKVTGPDGFTVPALKELEEALPKAVAACKGLLASPAVTEVTWESSKRKGKSKKEEAGTEDEE